MGKRYMIMPDKKYDKETKIMPDCKSQEITYREIREVIIRRKF